MLNHLVKDIKDVLTIEGDSYITYFQVYTICSQVHDYDDDYYEDVLELTDNDKFQDKEHTKEVIQNSWNALAQLLPDHNNAGLYVLDDHPVD